MTCERTELGDDLVMVASVAVEHDIWNRRGHTEWHVSCLRM